MLSYATDLGSSSSHLRKCVKTEAFSALKGQGVPTKEQKGKNQVQFELRAVIVKLSSFGPVC